MKKLVLENIRKSISHLIITASITSGVKLHTDMYLTYNK